MEYIMKGLEPADAWRYFEEISAIPRSSKNEKAVAEYVKKFAEERGLWVQMDEFYNLIIKKPGSKGCANLPAVLLQGHLDMVCEKEPGVEHDFSKEPIQLEIQQGNILRAKGTTLGADDGFAIAYMMAILDRQDLVHPPLECVMTVQEEIGLVGALKLDGSALTAKQMIGLDAGSEGKFLVTSSGGNFVDYEIPFTRIPFAGQAARIEIGGLLGGHSGGMADAERGNANKLMGRILYRISQQFSIHICQISGGTKVNAIPRECQCVVALPQGSLEKAGAIVSAIEAELKAEYAFSDPGVFVSFAESTASSMLDPVSSNQVIRALHLMPTGRQSMSKAIPGLINASLNVSSVQLAEDEGIIRIPVSIRSAENSLTKAITDELMDLAQILGFPAKEYGDYPAFSYSAQSPLRDKAMALYRQTSGKEPQILAVHGGTECGIFRSLCPGIDIIGFGPEKGDAHVPTEWMNIDSFRTTFQFLIRLLEELTR